MAHELLRLRESLVNTPHLIHPVTFNTILDYLDARNMNPEMFDDDDDYDRKRSHGRYSYNEDSKVALLNIDGPLTYRPIKMVCGGESGTNYQTIKEDFTHLADAGAKTIALYVNSGGGQAYQMMPTARYMREVADQYGIKVIAMVDGFSASAAYGLTSIADEIIMAEGAEVGSVGVLIQLMNDSEYLKKMGVERTFIYAGEEKIPYDKDGKWTKSFTDELQESVDELYEQFTSFVAENRNLTQAEVIGTNAKTFGPEKAIELGLADKLMTVEQFFDYLAEEAEANMKGDNSLLRNKLFNKPKVAPVAANKDEVNEEMTLQELQAQLEAAQAELSEKQSAFDALSATFDQFKADAQAAKETLELSLSQAEETIASLEADKVTTKLETRKAQLSKFVPTETATELSETFAALDDEAFGKVLASYSLNKKQKDEAELFEELGDGGAVANKDEGGSELSLVDKIKQATLRNQQ